MKPGLIVPYYHMVSNARVPHVEHLYRYKTPREFESDLDFLLRRYAPVGLGQILDCMRRGVALPEKAVLLTFDDGYREMSDVVAPILLQKGVTATFFVNSAFTDNRKLCYLNKASVLVGRARAGVWSSALVNELMAMFRAKDIYAEAVEACIFAVKYEQRDLLDRVAAAVDLDFDEYLRLNVPYLTTDQLRKLVAKGFTVGGHSIDHPLYRSLSLEDQVDQTISSVRFVRTTLNLKYGVFAFPHSDAGVKSELFMAVSKSGLVDLSFGTAGLVDDCVPNHLQRLSMENPPVGAERIVAFHLSRRLHKRLMGRSRISRD